MSDPRETFAPLDRIYPPLIGLTGLRGTGKTSAADRLVARYGFARVHPFGGGKEMCATLFMRYGATRTDAWRMVNGDLRDKPSDLLPGLVSPRLFMERFGRFMGDTMGPDWTLGAEIAHAWRDVPGRPLVVESVVYEAGVIRAYGGTMIRVTRPGHDGPPGIETDAAQVRVAVDATIINDGDLAALHRRVDQIAQQMIGGG